MNCATKAWVFAVALHTICVSCHAAERQSEPLGRGLIAVTNNDGQAVVSWRLLPTDPADVSFLVYCAVGDQVRQLNREPLTHATWIVDQEPVEADRPSREYFVRALAAGNELPASERTAVSPQGFLEIPIDLLEGYLPGDASVGDLNGDGQLEIVLHQTSRGRDNSFAGITGEPILDAYTLSGRRLWRINLGKNIREGEHYTQFLVYDLDGDGCAEVMCKTADGTVDGRGQVIGDADQDWRDHTEGSRTWGRILQGPEYLTVFRGTDGAALATVDYVPGREPINGWGGIGGNGGNDSYGNRCDRFLACVAYLDGQRPSAIMCRGVYGRTVLAAWDWRDGKLSQRWVFDTGVSYPPFADASPFSGMGGHAVSVADVDEDGRDEIVYQAMVVDDDGTGLYSTGMRHGDVLHVTDIDPQHPGLEVFTIQENEDDTVRFQTPGVALRDARTGEILWSHSPGIDVGQGLVADIDPRSPGLEVWGGPGGLRAADGRELGSKPRTISFAMWWDGDLLRELVSPRGEITKWNWQTAQEESLFAPEIRRGRFRGGRGPSFMGDIIGDWREELLIAAPDGKSLRLYTTTIAPESRQITLLADMQYRLSLVWQNVAYNKSPQLGRAMGETQAP